MGDMQVYYVYGFMLLVSIILIIVTTCVTIVGSYFLLNAENYHWQWTAFLSGASTAGYVYLYSFYFFAFKTQMTGFFQVRGCCSLSCEWRDGRRERAGRNLEVRSFASIWWPPCL